MGVSELHQQGKPARLGWRSYAQEFQTTVPELSSEENYARMDSQVSELLPGTLAARTRGPWNLGILVLRDSLGFLVLREQIVNRICSEQNGESGFLRGGHQTEGSKSQQNRIHSVRIKIRRVKGTPDK